MGWNTGVTRTTGDLITAAQWNSFLGAAGSLDYLKTETDKLDDCSHSEPTRVFDTIYQNTSGKIRLAMISLILSPSEKCNFLIGSGTPPTTNVGETRNDVNSDEIATTSTIVIPVNWYYEVEDAGAGAPTIDEWHEFDLH